MNARITTLTRREPQRRELYHGLNNIAFLQKYFNHSQTPSCRLEFLWNLYPHSTTESKVPPCFPIINRFPSFDCPVNKPEPSHHKNWNLSSPCPWESGEPLLFALEGPNCSICWHCSNESPPNKGPSPTEDEQVSPSPTEDNSNKFKIKCKQQHSSTSHVII